MLRLRLALFGLVGGMLLPLSGCFSMGDDCSMFPRLFSCSLFRPRMMAADCCECSGGCNSGYAPRLVETPVTTPGPFLAPPPAPVPGQTVPIPITNVPPTAPQIMRVPSAAPTPYIPQTH
jgi:hypothetical protein